MGWKCYARDGARRSVAADDAVWLPDWPAFFGGKLRVTFLPGCTLSMQKLLFGFSRPPLAVADRRMSRTVRFARLER